MAIRPQAVYCGAMKTAYDPLYARVQALRLPHADRELVMAWLVQAEAFAALVHGVTMALRRLIPARSARAPRSSGLRPTA
jgi:hypothetical protein